MSSVACHRGASRLAASGLLRSVCTFSTNTTSAVSSSACVDGATESNLNTADMQLCGRGDKRTWRGKIFKGSNGKARLKDKARNRSPQDMLPVEPIQVPPPPASPSPPTPILPHAAGVTL